MNAEKLTLKSQDAISSAHELAVDLNHQEMTPLHLFSRLIRQEQGLVPALLSKMSVSFDAVNSLIQQNLNTIPSVSGESRKRISLPLSATGPTYLSPN